MTDHTSEPMIAKARAKAPIKEVWHALTDPDAMRQWLAEEVNVDLPETYEFWGRYTPAGSAPHQRLRRAEPYTLDFGWLLDGVETTTSIELTEEAEGATLITVSQSHFDYAEMISGSSIRGVLQTYWALTIANLVDLVEGRPLTPRTDFTSSTFRAVVTIAAPADEVFTSLTQSDQVSQWFGFPVEIEPYEGGRFALGGIEGNPNPARISDYTPGERMTVDWGPSGVATWELEGSEGETRLTLVQSGFDTANPPYAPWIGTVSGLAELRRFHELSDWQPIWVAA
ncbi:SRPBCC family protein [Actinopolymorpha alba]|uniref:SRPBCC family protein n=1 Tax=Actinopolymorpha alba TaxID=533267 RepID=UPI00037CCD55|nr:SRPBCC domain-containing protein [Actinopolymorpha alba]